MCQMSYSPGHFGKSLNNKNYKQPAIIANNRQQPQLKCDHESLTWPFCILDQQYFCQTFGFPKARGIQAKLGHLKSFVVLEMKGSGLLGVDTRSIKMKYAAGTLLHTKPCGRIGCGDALGIQDYCQDQGRHQGAVGSVFLIHICIFDTIFLGGEGWGVLMRFQIHSFLIFVKTHYQGGRK